MACLISLLNYRLRSSASLSNFSGFELLLLLPLAIELLVFKLDVGDEVLRIIVLKSVAALHLRMVLISLSLWQIRLNAVSRLILEGCWHLRTSSINGR